MSKHEKIKLLESRIIELENENLTLKSLLKQQAVFGNKITQIVSEMDELLEKKKLEIQSLTNQLLAKSTSENVNDFTIDFVTESVSETKISFLELEGQVKLKKRNAGKSENQRWKIQMSISRYLQLCIKISCKSQKTHSNSYW